MTSPDGITWTARTAASSVGWKSVTYANGLFVAVAASAAVGQTVMTSPDGITWTSRVAAAQRPWESVAYGADRFVAVHNDNVPGFDQPRDMTSITSSPAPAPAPAPAVQVTVNLSGNGGSCSPSSLTGDQNTWATLPAASACSREGYELIGWNSSADGSGQGYGAGAQIQLTGTNTVYAQWRDIAPASETPSVAPSPSMTDSTTSGANTAASASARRSASTTVFFESGRSVLTEPAKAKLRALVEKTGTKVMRVSTVGYVQESGSKANDQSLSMARAQSVTEYLRSLGVRGKYSLRGEGISGPAAPDRKATTTITYSP